MLAGWGWWWWWRGGSGGGKAQAPALGSYVPVRGKAWGDFEASAHPQLPLQGEGATSCALSHVRTALCDGLCVGRSQLGHRIIRVSQQQKFTTRLPSAHGPPQPPFLSCFHVLNLRISPDCPHVPSPTPSQSTTPASPCKCLLGVCISLHLTPWASYLCSCVLHLCLRSTAS